MLLTTTAQGLLPVRKAFAIYHTWPDLKNAEYEVLQRILCAANNIDADVVVIDNGGWIIWSSPSLGLLERTQLNPSVVNFAISLHFESPRICDIYTYYALWQPISFYEDFGYQSSIDKLTTHNDLLSCHSDVADNHAMNLFNGLNRGPIEPLESMFHTLPEPFLAPNISHKSKMFYIGINWERVGRPKGRYHDLLVMLDTKDLIQIYGPEQIQGVAPWEGFQTYQGELPFDGYSIRDAINEAGVCLALSSVPHRNTGIMSNRLFEGLAGGAAVIATPNPLIDKYFRDVVYEVDDSRGEAALAQEIQSALRDIRMNPERAMDRVREGQRILREKCSLEGSLDSIFETNSKRIANFQARMLTRVEVTVILYFNAGNMGDLQTCIDNYADQKSCGIHLHVMLERQLASVAAVEAAGSLLSLTLHPMTLDGQPATFDGKRPATERTGPVVASILQTATTEYLAFLTQADRLFGDHFASLGKAIDTCPGAAMAAAGSLYEAQDATGRSWRALGSARMEDINSLVLANGPDQRGRFMFARHLFETRQHYLLQLLDGEEFRLLALAGALYGPVAQSNYATHLQIDTAPISIRDAVESVDMQQQYVRDYFRSDGRWLDRVSQGQKIPEFVHAYAPGADIRSSNTLRTGDQTNVFVPDRTYFMRAGEPVTQCLKSGFSTPEATAVWLAADRGLIEFSLPSTVASIAEDFDIVLSLAGRQSTLTGRPQHCTFLVNSIAVAYAEIGAGFSDIRLRMPINSLRNTNVFRLELVPDHAEQVIDDHGRVTDIRRLSLLIESLTITRDARGRSLSLRVNDRHACIQGDPIVRAMVSGFYAPETDQTWIAGRHATMQFRVSDVVVSPVIRLKVSARSSLLGEKQKLALKIGDREASEYHLSSDVEEIILACRSDDISDRLVTLHLSAHHAEPVTDEDGNLLDNRLLGVSLKEFGVYEAEPARKTQKANSGFSGRSRRIIGAVRNVLDGDGQ